MPKNKIEDLRNHLFETLEKLTDPDAKVDMDRVKSIAEISQVIINSAKLEVALMQVIGKNQKIDTGFIPTKAIEESND
jgi:hypothetical protein